MDSLVNSFLDENGWISPKSIADHFSISESDVIEIIDHNLSEDFNRTILFSDEFQSRLGEILEVLILVESWMEQAQSAWIWYRSEPITALGNVTADYLVRTGQYKALKNYLNSLAVGGFA